MHKAVYLVVAIVLSGCAEDTGRSQLSPTQHNDTLDTLPVMPRTTGAMPTRQASPERTAAPGGSPEEFAPMDPEMETVPTPPPPIDDEQPINAEQLLMPEEVSEDDMASPPPMDQVVSETHRVDSCGFNYGFPEPRQAETRTADMQSRTPTPFDRTEPVAYVEPLPASTWYMPLHGWHSGSSSLKNIEGLTMPAYNHEFPLFERATPWLSERRCYELPSGAAMLSEAQSYDLWVRVVEKTLWLHIDQTPGVRTVVGLRGAYPGTFAWHGNAANWFNDTLVLLWRDTDDVQHVREFPVNTDTGARDFGYHSSSSLRPNRYYPYINDWHRSYNALRINTTGYSVRDDTNNNGHWDDDRNGWFDGGPDDHYRAGSGHNIHTAEPSHDLHEQPVNRWSAGCQVIPGMDNWIEFIGNAWTGLGDQVDYFLIDARDIASATWSACDMDDGTHQCPHNVRRFPYSHSGNTATSAEFDIDRYNCSEADEGGAEVVYVMNIRESGTLSVTVSTDDDQADPDIHLLWGDDANACLTRAHESFEYPITPGRYLLIVDTWVNESGEPLPGSYELEMTLR